MRTITVSVQDEIMKLSSNNAGAAGSYNVVTLEISFGDAWDGMTKKLYFYDAHGKNLVYILLGSSNLKLAKRMSTRCLYRLNRLNTPGK
jgi:hypothetical protein